MRNAPVSMRCARHVDMLRFLLALVRSQILIGSFAILAFCTALGLLVFVLSWFNYRDQYGISLADFFKLMF